MTYNTMTYGDINQRTAIWAAVEALSHAEPVMILSRFGMNKPMPKNKSESVKFRRYIPLAAATTPLSEGVTPTAQRFAYEDISATLKQYGKHIELTDKIVDMNEDPVLKDMMMAVGEQAGATIEQIIWGVIRAGTNVFYANGSSRGAVNTVLTLNKQRAVTRALKANKAKPINRMLKSGAEYGVSAISAGYIAISHTNLESDIRNLSGFVPIEKYGSGSAISEYEIGAVESVRYILSPDLGPFINSGGTPTGMLSTGGSAADVYPIIYLGMEAYGLVPLKGVNAMTPMVLNPGTPRGGDPLGQRGSVGWKTFFTAVILNDLWMARLEVAVTSL